MARRLDTLQTAELAEGVEIHLRVAGPFLRMGALMLDILFTHLILIVGGMIGAFFWGLFGGDEGLGRVLMGIGLLAYFLINWFYPVILESGKKGATWGKRATGLKVVSETGTRITLGQAMVRNFIRSVELLLPLLPMVAFFHPRFQRLGDMAAGTLVVYAKERVDGKLGPPDLTQSVPVSVNLTREEQAALLSFRDRSSTWSEARRIELADQLHPLTGKSGVEGVQKVLGMARWLEDGK